MSSYVMYIVYSLILGVPFVICFMAVRLLKQNIEISKLKIMLTIIEGIMIQYTITIFSITLIPLPGLKRIHLINLIPFSELFDFFSSKYIINPGYIIKLWVLNIIMFVPFGILGTLYLRLKNKKIEHVFISGLGLIIFIESVQYFLINGRTADINDVITNMTGIFLGYILSKKFLVSYFGEICD